MYPYVRRLPCGLWSKKINMYDKRGRTYQIFVLRNSMIGSDLIQITKSVCLSVNESLTSESDRLLHLCCRCCGGLSPQSAPFLSYSGLIILSWAELFSDMSGGFPSVDPCTDHILPKNRRRCSFHRNWYFDTPSLLLIRHIIGHHRSHLCHPLRLLDS